MYLLLSSCEKLHLAFNGCQSDAPKYLYDAKNCDFEDNFCFGLEIVKVGHVECIILTL